MKLYRAKLKSRKRIMAEIPREQQGWWADVCPGKTLILRDATEADIARCSINEGQSRDPADYLCETVERGALVKRIAIEVLTEIPDRRAALPAAQLDADNLPPRPERVKFYPDRHGFALAYTSDQMRDYARSVVAPYAERIRLLEREAADFKIWSDKTIALCGAIIENLQDEVAALKRELVAPPERTKAQFLAAERAGVSFSTQQKCWNAWFGAAAPSTQEGAKCSGQS